MRSNFPQYDLTYVFNTMEENNLDIKRKKFLVDAANDILQ